MLQYFNKIYFIFVLYMIFQNKYCISQENGTKETDILSTPTERCESKFCSFAVFSMIHFVYCSDGNESGLLYIKFHGFKHLHARQFLGLRIKHLILSDANITVDEDFLEGTMSLVEFEVIESSIEIIPDFRIVKDSIQIIKIDSSRLTSLEGGNLQNLTSVIYLSFFNNSIEYIDPNVFKGTDKVKKLDLSYNLLTSIPPGLLNGKKDLKFIYLSHNNLLHIDHLFSSTVLKIQDIHDIRCGISEEGGKSNLNGTVILKLPDGFYLCPTTEQLIVEHCTYYLDSVIVLAFVIFCLAAKILYTKYEFDVKVFLYGYGFKCWKDEDTDYDKMFDAFVCFGHDDEEFAVKEIILGIEEQCPTINLCLRYRDFLPGNLIADNIVRAVQNSKSTVFILSRNFLVSEWCLLEFRTAHEQALQDKRHRIIVVKVGDLPKEVDPTIKMYLDSTKCLTWAERNFWKKMLYVLPSQCRVIDPVFYEV